MEIKIEVEKMVSNKNYSEVVRTTLPFLLHLKENEVKITEEVFKHFLRHVLSGNIRADKKEIVEFFVRDSFARICEVISDDLVAEVKDIENAKKPEADVVKTPLSNNEMTPELMAQLEADLPPYEEPKPSEWFLNLQKQLGIKEEE